MLLREWVEKSFVPSLYSERLCWFARKVASVRDIGSFEVNERQWQTVEAIIDAGNLYRKSPEECADQIDAMFA